MIGKPEAGLQEDHAFSMRWIVVAALFKATAL
jgi:hypothetical protein